MAIFGFNSFLVDIVLASEACLCVALLFIWAVGANRMRRVRLIYARTC